MRMSTAMKERITNYVKTGRGLRRSWSTGSFAGGMVIKTRHYRIYYRLYHPHANVSNRWVHRIMAEEEHRNYRSFDAQIDDDTIMYALVFTMPTMWDDSGWT